MGSQEAEVCVCRKFIGESALGLNPSEEMKAAGWGRRRRCTMMRSQQRLRLTQRFSTGGPREVLKHAIPDYLVRGTDLFSLRLSNKK